MTIFLGRSATLLYIWKKISQKWTAFTFGNTYLHQTFTECTQILIYWYVRCVFFVFSHIFDDHSCLNCCISTKHSLIVYLISTDMSKCQMWLQVMESFLIFIMFFMEFREKLTNIMSEGLYLHQTFLNYIFDVNINISI